MAPAEPVSGVSHAGTHQPRSVPPSPEKEAFKKRQKMQQDNGEETDENEVEEVSGHCAHTAGVSGCGALELPLMGQGPSSAWL